MNSMVLLAQRRRYQDQVRTSLPPGGALGGWLRPARDFDTPDRLAVALTRPLLPVAGAHEVAHCQHHQAFHNFTAKARFPFRQDCGERKRAGRMSDPCYHESMVRILSLTAVLSFAALPAVAWEFTPGTVCLLAHATPEAEVALTYDPAVPEYTITVSRSGRPFPVAPVFAMRFDGPRGLTISTTRHQNPEGDPARVRVIDTGFDNVLDGLQFNRTATALVGDDAVEFSLDGAAGPVAEFRACTDAALA